MLSYGHIRNRTIIVDWLVKEDKVPSSLKTRIPTSSQFLGHGIPFLIEKWNVFVKPDEQ